MSRPTGPAELVKAHLTRMPNTAKCYRIDLARFAAWATADVVTAVGDLLEGGRAFTKRQLLSWITAMRIERLAGKTIRRRVAAVTSLLALALDFDLIDWSIGRLPLPSASRVRDCTGPDLATTDRLFDICTSRNDRLGWRNNALLSLLYFEGFRASEVLSIRWPEDVDLTSRPAHVRMVSKTQQGRLSVGICTLTRQAVERWRAQRGDEPGALFLACPRGRDAKARPLSYEGLRAAVRAVGKIAGVKLWAHALRHAALSHLALYTADSPAWGCALSRHKEIKAWMDYQDRAVSHASASEVLSRRQSVRGVQKPTTDK